ncbi:alpha/beta fold hydrolase [Cellulomonas xiejunii]|uniref:Alpha/beta fold hydrolase n=1 Tax=Cellulomonas xiejunii TaxID=2968083 RepID=A0ABY5KPF0_9CELL|nr:alpha/beta fold hydrolase [Cellulomonas xiejunii]MCC2322207.1 alpha/beta fold hydrolase [Cellulomonas xiejunii]UUI72260.1 alpha/beta fold hydrolase [Cellulomonas xiejunii]
MRVTVVPYDDDWPAAFRRVEAELDAALASVDVRSIEHVGSTAVPGLPAKPVIDVDVVVDAAQLAPAIAALGAAGYTYTGEQGIPGRHAVTAPAGGTPRHVYVCVDGCLALRNHLAVRHVLRADPALRAQYAAVKRALAGRELTSMDEYVAGKTAVLRTVLSAAGMTTDDLDAVAAVNSTSGAGVGSLAGPVPVETSVNLQVLGRSLAAVRHEAGGDAVVLFCHGFRGEKSGPNRTFVRAARRLAQRGISSIRFDQYGSGDSAGDFLESRFTVWVDTIAALAREQRDLGRRVALFGQSMGGSAVLCAAAQVPVDAVVAWVPDASVDEFSPGPQGFVEEGGQRVGNAFWQEAHDAGVPDRFRTVTAPCHLVFGTADAYVSTQNREALLAEVGPDDRVDVFDGYPHSAWTYDQAEDVIARSVAFLVEHLATPAP